MPDYSFYYRLAYLFYSLNTTLVKCGISDSGRHKQKTLTMQTKWIIIGRLLNVKKP